MSWVRLDDQFPDHPKVAGLSNDAFCLHVTAMCWTAKQQTDGKLPSRLLSRLAWRCQDPVMAKEELVTAGVWDVDPVDGWNIHDYGEYNPTKVVSEELSAIRSQAGKAGAAKRWQLAKQTDSKQHGKTMPPSPSPSDDDDREAALKDLQALGLFNSTMLAQFDDVWPELAGRRDWVGRAITVARDSSARSPLSYALKVLANAIHTGNPPGYTNGQSKVVSFSGGQSKPISDEQYARDMAKQAIYEQCLAEGIHDWQTQEQRYREAGLL